MCLIRQHLHHADEQGSSCPIPKSQPAGAGDAMCMWPCFWDPGEEQDLLSQRPDPSQSATGFVDLSQHCSPSTPAPRGLPARAGEQNSWPSSPSHFALFSPFLAASPGDFRGSKDHPAPDRRQPSLLAQTTQDSHSHPLTAALSPAPSESPQASGLTRCSGSCVASVNEETEPHPSPSPNYGTLKWATSRDIPASFWGSSISAGAGWGWLLSPRLGIVRRSGLQHLAAPFWQAALSKARPPISACLSPSV